MLKKEKIKLKDAVKIVQLFLNLLDFYNVWYN